MSQFDAIIAAILIGFVMLTLLHVRQQSTETTVADHMMYVSKAQMLELADLLEKDLVNVGLGTHPEDPRILSYTERANGTLNTFAFWGLGNTGDRRQITYQLVEVDTMSTQDGPIPLYQLNRLERDNMLSPQAYSGGSAPTLSDLRLYFYDENRQPVADTDDARILEVRLRNAVMPDAQTDEYRHALRHLYYAIWITPASLQN